MRAQPYKCNTSGCQNTLSGVGKRCGRIKKYCDVCLVKRKALREYNKYHNKIKHI